MLDLPSRTACSFVRGEALSREGRCSGFRRLRPVAKRGSRVARQHSKRDGGQKGNGETHAVRLGVHTDLGRNRVVLHVLLANRSTSLDSFGTFLEVVTCDRTFSPNSSQRTFVAGARRGEQTSRKGQVGDEENGSESCCFGVGSPHGSTNDGLNSRDTTVCISHLSASRSEPESANNSLRRRQRTLTLAQAIVPPLMII